MLQIYNNKQCKINVLWTVLGRFRAQNRARNGRTWDPTIDLTSEPILELNFGSFGNKAFAGLSAGVGGMGGPHGDLFALERGKLL